MKNIKIFPKDWLQLHPYKQSTPVDSYYTGIANRIYDIMEKTELVNSFEGEETKQICIRMAAYFEDVISGMGIWRAFILTHKELYGKYLPFYTPDDHYYDDEVNLEDVRFLLWHYTQQYHGYRQSGQPCQRIHRHAYLRPVLQRVDHGAGEYPHGQAFRP